MPNNKQPTTTQEPTNNQQPTTNNRSRLKAGRLLVWGINYAPEVTGIAPCNVALCGHMAARGWSVTALTTFPYYPTWAKRPCDRGKLYGRERIDGVNVVRCWHHVPELPGARARVLHEASFVATSFLRLLTLRRPDAVVVVSPPLLLGLAARLYGWVRRVPYWFHVQDLQPEAGIALAMIPDGGRAARLLRRLASWSYRGASVVSGIAPGMLDAFRRAGVPEERLQLLPNGVDPVPASVLGMRGRFRTRHAVPEDRLVAVYSGNIGEKQGLDVVLDAARILEEGNACPVTVFLVGDGAARARLMAEARARGIGNVRWLPLLDEAEYAGMMVDADVALVPQRPGAGANSFPSKFLRALSYGVPVVVSAEPGSDLAAVFRDAGEPGVRIAPGAPSALASALSEQCADRACLGRWREQARAWAARHTWERALVPLAARLERVVRG